MKEVTAVWIIILCAVFCFIMMLFSFKGCASLPAPDIYTIKPSCGHYAVLTTLTFRDFRPFQKDVSFKVRIVVGPQSPGMYHAQGQVLINGKWEWLRFDEGVVVLTNQDNFEPILFLDVEEFMKRYY